MTKEQYIKRKNDIESQITNLKSQRRQLDLVYVTFSKFKVGDRVLVTRGGNTTECFIAQINIGWDNEFKYQFNKVKKDGTMSGQSTGIYYPEKIELMTTKQQ